MLGLRTPHLQCYGHAFNVSAILTCKQQFFLMQHSVYSKNCGLKKYGTHVHWQVCLKETDRLSLKATIEVHKKDIIHLCRIWNNRAIYLIIWTFMCTDGYGWISHIVFKYCLLNQYRWWSNNDKLIATVTFETVRRKTHKHWVNYQWIAQT